MKYLLDTNVAIWMLAGDEESFSERARSTVNDPTNALFLSAVCIWEIAIKRSLGKLRAPDDWFEQIMTFDFATLPITPRHARGVEKLPPRHNDPFDRLLISQSIAEGMPVITSDSRFSAYPTEIVW